MGAFGSMDLAAKFGIVFGGLIALTILAGIVKLYLNKKKLKRDTEKENLEAASKGDKEKLVQRGVREGDLFGVRAIEHGYFGGVSQSRPNSPSPSYVLSPSTSVGDFSKTAKSGSHSASSSVLTIPQSQPKRKPSPLALDPSAAQHNDRANRSPSNAGGMGGSYIPPIPSPRSQQGVSPSLERGKTDTWVSPLDVQFSRPSTPKARPTSYLPKLRFPEEIAKTGLFSPSRNDFFNEPHSETASIVSGDTTITRPATVAQVSPLPKSPSFSFFPQADRSQAASNSSSSLFPNDVESSTSARRNPKEAQFIPKPVQLETLSPTYESTSSKEKPSSPNPFEPIPNRATKPLSPITRDSVASEQRVSVFQSSKTNNDSNDIQARNGVRSIAASSLYSTATPIINGTTQRSRGEHSRSRSRSTSAGGKHSASSSLSRTQDSLRRHSRKASTDSLNRRSRDRDQMHYDPTQHARNRSGSVQGRKIDFDHPRESPFSNANAIATHSRDASAETVFSDEEISSPPPPMPYATFSTPQISLPELALQNDAGRVRSESAGSQGSIGDFYDAYYRRSAIGSAASQAQDKMGRNSPMLDNSGESGKTGTRNMRRPPPLKLGDTILEVASPTPTPVRTEERGSRIL